MFIYFMMKSKKNDKAYIQIVIQDEQNSMQSLLFRREYHLFQACVYV